MFIITNKFNVVIKFANNVTNYNENFIMADGVLFQTKEVNIYEKDDISEIKVLKHCYDGKNITTNPNYIEPTETYMELKQQLNELKTEKENLEQQIIAQQSAINALLGV